jgi:hypothetical protein
MERTQHYLRYREDLSLVKGLGIDVLRYGVPYYKVHAGPGRYEWDFADAAFDEIRRLDQLDWDSLLVEDNGRLNHYGLFSLERRIRPVGEPYRGLIAIRRGKISNGMLSLY